MRHPLRACGVHRLDGDGDGDGFLRGRETVCAQPSPCSTESRVAGTGTGLTAAGTGTELTAA